MTPSLKNEYTIQRVAEMTGISAHTLRYYEKIGLLAPVKRHSNQHRRYSENDLGWIDFIKLLRETGMPLRQMQRFMQLARRGAGTISDRIVLLSDHRRELFTRIAELQAHLEHLDRKIAYYQGIAARKNGQR
ncbi:putative HTH-type transcriptional regulator [Thermoflexales bacterium]|nr:putative HTH-type transcriptional regulator [Thermoflexales bacterium]